MVAVEGIHGELLSGQRNMEWRPVKAMADTLRRYANCCIANVLVIFCMARKCHHN